MEILIDFAPLIMIFIFGALLGLTIRRDRWYEKPPYTMKGQSEERGL